MQERLRAFGRGIKDRWESLDKGQKTKLGITAAVLFVTLIATIYIMTRPKWVELINNKSHSETGLIQNALTNEGITARLVNNSTGVAVREQDKDKALIVLSDSTALSGMDFTFQNALDASGMGSTERVKNEAFQRAFESDLGRLLELYDWVNTASVKIVFPDADGFFARTEENPTAAILLSTKWNPDEAQAMNVARLVSRSVKNLSMENIEITDQNAQTLYSGLQKSMGATGSEDDIRRKRENEMDAKVRAVLIPIYDEVKTIPNLIMNWNKSETVSTQYESPDPDSPVGVPTTRRTENSSVTGGSTDAEPGAVENSMTTPTYETGTTSESSAQTKISEEELIYNETTQRIESGIGEVVLADSSMSVYLYKHRHHYQQYMEENGQLEGQTWEQFIDATASQQTRLDIDPEIVESLRTATQMDNLYVIGYEVPVFHEYIRDPIRIEQYVIFAILALLILLLAYGLIRKTQPDEVLELEPELTVESMIVSSQMEEEKEKEIEELQPIGLVTESESRMQINKFIDERPEVVAALLRNWLNDDWD